VESNILDRNALAASYTKKPQLAPPKIRHGPALATRCRQTLLNWRGKLRDLDHNPERRDGKPQTAGMPVRFKGAREPA
jgi:hypothetical protein